MATTKKTTTKKAPVPKKVAPVKEPEQSIVAPPVEEEKINYVIPLDKSLESNDQFFEYNLNGINYRFKRGVILSHPRNLYDAISAVLFRRERVSPYIAEFMNTSKKLN